MDNAESTLINQRIDDVRADLKESIQDIKNLIIQYNEDKNAIEKRVGSLENFKSKFLGMTSGISLVVGAIFGYKFL